jgi:hypothetical protein
MRNPKMPCYISSSYPFCPPPRCRIIPPKKANTSSPINLNSKIFKYSIFSHLELSLSRIIRPKSTYPFGIDRRQASHYLPRLPENLVSQSRPYKPNQNYQIPPTQDIITSHQHQNQSSITSHKPPLSSKHKT